MAKYELLGTLSRGDRSTRVVITDGRIIFRNFSGARTQFNQEGDRNFCVVIENEEFAKVLSDAGWNVKQWLNRNDPDVAPMCYMKCSVSYRFRAPKVMLINGNSMTDLTEDTVGTLDQADIESCDIVLNPSYWEVNGNQGVKAYLEEIYVKVRPSYFADKYRTHSMAGNDDAAPGFPDTNTGIPGDIPFNI